MMTTTTQKKNTMMPGMAYPATALVLATAVSYPPAQALFDAEVTGPTASAGARTVPARETRAPRPKPRPAKRWRSLSGNLIGRRGAALVPPILLAVGLNVGCGRARRRRRIPRRPCVAYQDAVAVAVRDACRAGGRCAAARCRLKRVSVPRA
jgi:hypothetical protein